MDVSVSSGSMTKVGYSSNTAIKLENGHSGQLTNQEQSHTWGSSWETVTLAAPHVCEKGGADAHQMPGVHVVKSHQFLVNIQVASWKWL